MFAVLNDARRPRKAGVRADREPADGGTMADRLLPIIDVDTHCGYAPEGLAAYLPANWQWWIEHIGVRSDANWLQIPRHREFAHRLDSIPANGIPGSDPVFAREQLLDRYGLVAAFLNILPSGVGGNEPDQLGVELARAQNDYVADNWLSTDPRWRASISVWVERADAAAAEIGRRAEADAQWEQVMLGTRSDCPLGNPKYWPIFEAAAHHDLPIAWHIGSCRSSQLTGCGMPNYYYEDHVELSLPSYSAIASLIFEGVFDRFPNLKIVSIEQGWSWVAPLVWRLDASWRVMREEVPHLHRKPSEYISDHFWFTTQPLDQPPQRDWLVELFSQLERTGLSDHLMFASDYPHWDFDAPNDVFKKLPPHLREGVLARNASELYGIELPAAALPRQEL